MRSAFLLSCPLLLLLPLAAGAVTPIGSITDAPDAYDGKRVTVAGTVDGQQVGFRGESVYTLAEDGRRITVVSSSPAPAPGAHLQVDGDVFVHPEGSSEIDWPPVLREATRTTLP